MPKAVRAAYHAQRWLAGRDGADLLAVKQLAAGAPAGSTLARVWQTLQQLNRQAQLAEALSQRRAGLAAEPLAPPADRSATPLERLAEAILEVLPAGAVPGPPPRTVAERVLQELPPAGEVPEELRVGLLQLSVWACLALRRFELICGNHAALRAAFPAAAEQMLLAAARGWGQDALLRNDRQQAQVALDGATALAGPAVRRGLVLQWGLAALERSLGEGAVQWFFAHARQRLPDDPAEWRAAVLFGLGTALLQSGRYGEGREVLQRLDQLPALAAAGAAPAEDTPTLTLLGQVCFLQALSLLAGTADWTTPPGTPDAAAAGRDRELAVRYRALWIAIREQLAPLVQRLESLPPAQAWKGHLLAGLTASADSEVTPELPRLTQFSAAIDRVESATARTRLRQIEAALLTRVQATDQALALIDRGDPARLRELKEVVLDPLGDSIPPLVRAAVYVSLGNADPTYDPLSDLQRIPLDPSNEPLIQPCLTQAQTARTLRHLAAEVVRPDAAAGTLPDLLPLAGSDPGVVRAGHVAAALVLLRRQEFSAAAEVLPEPSADVESDACRLSAILPGVEARGSRGLPPGVGGRVDQEPVRPAAGQGRRRRAGAGVVAGPAGRADRRGLGTPARTGRHAARAASAADAGLARRPAHRPGPAAAGVAVARPHPPRSSGRSGRRVPAAAGDGLDLPGPGMPGGSPAGPLHGLYRSGHSAVGRSAPGGFRIRRIGPEPPDVGLVRTACVWWPKSPGRPGPPVSRTSAGAR